jgi:CO/xanthine dehydrogenase FAD-binding subunit
MFTIDELLQPGTVGEAAEILKLTPDVVVLGGCAFLKMGSRHISLAMDLSRCGLNAITETAEMIEIGAMATLRDLEKNVALKQYFNAVVPRAVGNIIGVQFRSCATVGASVYSKYGFSDLLTALLALDTDVELINNGRMSLGAFMDKPYPRDILTRIFIKKDDRYASYQNLRNAAADFPMLNVAVSRFGNQWTIVVGSRPLRAMVAVEASRKISSTPVNELDIDAISLAVSTELSFGKNSNASAEYRQAMSQVLVKRAIEEVLSCK